MAITKAQFEPRGYGVQKTRFANLGDYQTSPLEVHPAYYLKTQEEDKRHDLWFVVLAGQFVAFDRTSLNSAVYEKKQLVIANGGTAQSLTYTSDDVTAKVLDIDELNAGRETVLTAAKTCTKQIAANRPCGVAPYNYYCKATEKTYWNVFPQPNVTYMTGGIYEIPLIYRPADGALGVAAADDQDSLDSGLLVRSGALGWPVRWVNGSDNLEQLCGRLEQLVVISTTVDALDKVHTVPGLNLPGTGTSGRQIHEDFYVLGSTSTKVATKARIRLMF